MTSSKVRRSMDSKGFTLVELLIAITILSFGLLAVASMQISAMMGNMHAKGVTEGSTVVADQLEKLMVLPYDSIVDGSTTRDRYDLTWTVQEDTPETNTKTVVVTATWTDTGVSKHTQIQQVIARLE